MMLKSNKNLSEYIKANEELNEVEEDLIFRRQKAFDKLLLEEGNSEETLFLIRLAHFELYKDKMMKRIGESRKFDHE